MKSLAIWHSGNEKDKPELDIHFNFWKLPTQRSKFRRFLDIGLNLHNANIIEKIFLYLPFTATVTDLSDLGKVIARGSANLLTAIFNEDYQITNNATSDYHEIKNNTGESVFYIYGMNTNNFKVEHKHEGTIITISLPKIDIRKEKTYLRFRISANNLENFSHIEKNVSSVLNSAFTKTEIFDFRINSMRHLPNKLLEEITQLCMFKIVKIHFFYICSYRENYILSHRPFFGARKLEDGIWDKYISIQEKPTNTSNLGTLIAYHWKEKADKDKTIEKFNILMKTDFRHNNWLTIIKYLFFLSFFTIMSGIATNYLYSIISKQSATTAEIVSKNEIYQKLHKTKSESITEQPVINKPDEKKE